MPVTRVIMTFLIPTLINIFMNIYISLGFYAFQSIFFATTYHMCFIHSSYLISGFGARNIFLNILLIPVNYTLLSQHLYFQSIQCLIMAMPPNIYISLGFYAFQSTFFATTYHMCIIHSSYLISGFGARNIFLNILLIPVNYTLLSQHLYFQSIQYL